jgi:hypothetical protein
LVFCEIQSRYPETLVKTVGYPKEHPEAAPKLTTPTITFLPFKSTEVK